MRKEITWILSILSLISLLIPPSIRGGDFLPSYWSRPIPPQSQKGLSLSPQGCGECHREQYDDWRSALHSRSVGPGILGQLDPSEDPQFAASCYFCHAPMTEQSEVTSQESGQWGRPFVKNPFFDKELKLSGVSCSVCHLREGEVYGPVKRKVENQNSKVKIEEQKAHDFIEKDFFEKAEFCAACHQMDQGYELNGKVLTNTYREWKESFYGKNNIPCQSCHMPERRHLFRGIHDPEMVKSGVKIEVKMDENPSPHPSPLRGEGNTKNSLSLRERDRVRVGFSDEVYKAQLKVTNIGAGHYFPTYVTPLLVVKGYLIDGAGKIIEASLQEGFIGRKVDLDLTEELFDTRIPPFKDFVFNYEIKGRPEAQKLILKIEVLPDEFYNRFFKKALEWEDDLSKKRELEEALRNTERSQYILFEKEIELQ